MYERYLRVKMLNLNFSSTTSANSIALSHRRITRFLAVVENANGQPSGKGKGGAT
jgi:hypothetical protein